MCDHQLYFGDILHALWQCIGGAIFAFNCFSSITYHILAASIYTGLQTVLEMDTKEGTVQ